MPRIVGWLLLLAALGLASFTLVAVGARFHDGPLGPIPGGPFQESDSDPSQLDPASVAGRETVEIEVGATQAISRTTWVLVNDGVLYIPAGMAARKKWPGEAAAAGRLRLRVDGRVFALKATRVTDPATIQALRRAVDAKYGTHAQDGGALADGTWFFRLDPPSAPSGANERNPEALVQRPTRARDALPAARRRLFPAATAAPPNRGRSTRSSYSRPSLDRGILLPGDLP